MKTREYINPTMKIVLLGSGVICQFTITGSIPDEGFNTKEKAAWDDEEEWD